MPKALDLIGKKFGRLQVVQKLDARDKFRKIVWECKCSCGKTAFVNTKNLRTKNTQSCGCLRMDKCRTHGMSKTRIYKLWVGMVNRCHNPNNPNYPNYGAKGISVCKRWRNFENFIADMGERPEGMSIDRIKNSKGYTPRNCHWATDTEQALNKNTTRFITYRGEKLCVSHWAKKLGMRHDTLTLRLNAGWSVEKALTTPVRK